MTGSIKRIVAARFGPGEDVLQELERLVQEAEITSGFILSGVGSLKKAVFRVPRGIAREFPITDRDRYAVEFAGSSELSSLDGNIAVDAAGQVVVHAHGVVALGDAAGGKVVGGHLLYGTIVYSTVEVILAEVAGLAFRRRIDAVTQMAEFCVE